MNQQSEIKRICIYGTGGVGGFFGGQMTYNLKQADKSTEIYFISRGEHLKKIQEEGLTLITPQKSIVAYPTAATNNFENLKTPDLILICVKEYDLDEAVHKISKNMDESTIILPLLNGIDIYHRIREKISKGVILPSCVYVGTHIEKPGVVHQNGGDGIIIFGNDPECSDFDINVVIELLKKLNINYKFQKDPFPAIWEKYIFIASFGLVSAAYNKTLGEIMENQELKDYIKGIMEEIVFLAELEGVKLKKTIVEESLKKGNNFPYETTTSYHKDVETIGKKNEGDLFGGTIIRLGKQYGVKTPFTRKMYSIIQNKD
jgi:2-dehydropantoate 2-reductase